MTFLDILLLVFGIYYLIDGVAGYLQTRSVPFLYELLGAWLIATVSPVSSVPALWTFLVAIGGVGLLAIGVTIVGLFRSDQSRQPMREFIAIKRQPRTLVEQYTFRYKPYAHLPPQPPSAPTRRVHKP